MANLRLVPENAFDDAVLSDSPVALSTMPTANVQLTARDRVMRSTSNAPQTIFGHWNGDIRTLSSFFIFDHTGHGGTVQLILYPNSDFTGAAVYDSGELSIYTLCALGDYEWGMAPLGLPQTDVVGAEAPFSHFFTEADCCSFSITFRACQYSYWQIGRIFGGRYSEAPYNPDYGMTFNPASNTEHRRSRGGSLRTQPGSRWPELSADMRYATDVQRAAWRDLMKVVTNRDVVISIFPGAGGKLERDHTFNARLAEQPIVAWANYGFNESTIRFIGV